MSEGRPAAGATFEVRSVGGGRSRSSLATVAWLGALALAVGFAALDRTEPEMPTAIASVEVPGIAASAEPLTAEPLTAEPLSGPSRRSQATIDDSFGPIELLAPASNRIGGGEDITIEGRMRVRAARVAIYVESGRGRIFDRAVVRLPDLSGEFRPDRQATFRAAFALPEVQPTTIVIVIAAYDAAGKWLGTLRQPIAVGPPLVDVRVAAPLSR
jgi:hypothetical protein